MNVRSEKGVSLLDNVQLVLSLGYIFMVLVGIIFTGSKYRILGVNIFEYTDLFDFLISPFKDVKIILHAILPLACIYFFIRLDTFVSVRFKSFYSKCYFGIDRKAWFKTFMFWQWLLAIVVYVALSSVSYAKNSKEDLYESKNNYVIEFQDNTQLVGRKIGSNPNFLFLLDDQDSVSIIPINSFVKRAKFKND